LHVTGLALGTTAALLVLTLFSRASAPPVSREALEVTFDAGIRRLVIEWDAADPRPAAERRQALFDFMYQTYQASAWIPQSLFDSNMLSQAVIGDVDTIVGDQVGLVRWRDNPLVPAFGMAPNAGRSKAEAGADAPASLKWTVNCLVCHMAEIDGVAYFGAGTKTFDELWLGEALKRLTSDPWRALVPVASGDRALAADANRILNSHHHDKIDSLTRARSTAFAASHVELYMRSHGNEMPGVDSVGRGDVKTPPLWHTAAKMSAGRWYTDGSFHGPFPLMASSMELEKDRPFDALVEVRSRRSKPSSRPSSATCGRRVIRTKSIRRSRRAGASCSTHVTSAARGAMGRTTGRATWTGRASTPTSAPIGRASTWSRTSSSRRSIAARSPRAAGSVRAAGMRPRRSRAYGRTTRIFTTGACRPSTICWDRPQSGPSSFR
jgi:hypothetical protein